MDMRGISAVLLKITGLVMVVMCIAQVPSYFSLMTREGGWSFWQITGTAAMTLGPLTVAGLVLWFFPGTVANKIVSVGDAAQGSFDWRPLELIALTILGLYLIARGVVNLTFDVVVMALMLDQSPDFSSLPLSTIARMVAAGAELAIGFILCIRRRGVIRILERLRT
ncbi:MAG TPA: hypothetical protein VFE23_00515 [Usitatibacter sp.]|jgi:hypothetical protein|nr:hypothetical protein [Usitatibacter sp.]